jgi:hypothetical protein
MRELISKLMGSRMNVANAIAEIEKLDVDDANKVFSLLEIKIRKASDLSKQPNGIDGIKALVAHHSALEDRLVTFIGSFNPKSVGVWICQGWGSCVKSASAKTKFNAYLSKLQSEGSNLMKAAAKTAFM